MVLQSIRDRLNGIIAIFILSILIIPFAFVGVNSYFTSDAINSVAVVNEQEITINDFNTGFQNYRRQMQSQLGTAFDPEQFDQAIVRRQFLDRMIDEELLAQVSIDAGLTVTNERLKQSIVTLPAFEVDGEFNQDVYQQRLTSQGLTPQQFEIEMRSSLVMSQFPTAIAGSAISTRWELEDYVRLQDQERAFKAVLVPAFPAEEAPEEETPEDELNADEAPADDPQTEDLAQESVETDEADDVVIEEEALLAWYEAHQNDYLSEEMVLVEYLELDAAALGGSVEPDEDQLRARFDEQQARFITPEARLASHILIEVESTAPQVDGHRLGHGRW
jgi:peptidyl-prolyl cis-trans isomerase D